MNRRAVGTLAAGLGLIAVAQLAAPIGSPPLYDGVVVQDPYRYLLPAPGQAGSPTSYHGTLPVTGTTSPQFVAATTEIPPQAQIVAQPGSFVLPTGVTSLVVSIEVVAAPAAPSSGALAGNVYRLSVAAQSGDEIPIDGTSPPTLILRAPADAASAGIVHFDAGTWQAVSTAAGGQPGIYLANVSTLGDYALLVPPQDAVEVVISGIAIAITALVVVGVFLFLRRPRRSAAPVSEPRGRSSPTKRRRGGRRRGGPR